jgi:hypothetical protein
MVELITTDEALQLLKFATISEMFIVERLEKAYRNSNGYDRELKWDRMKLLSFIYDTARIQGIREERARHKAVYNELMA